MLVKSNKLFFCVLVLFFLIVTIINVAAEETVKIGLITPLTGPIAVTGEGMRDAAQVAIDIVNGEYPDLKYGLAPTAGLPNLGGAKIELIIGNTQTKPEYGRSEAERLITINKVVALVGSFNSGVTKTASQIAERYKIPFITGLSTSTDLTERGFKYFFRTTLTEDIFCEAYLLFLEDLNKTRGANIKNIGLLYEDSEWGVNLALDIKKKAKEHGFNIVSNVKFPSGAADLDSEVSILKRDNPDFLVYVTLISDSILYARTAKKLDYNVSGMVGGQGFSMPIILDTLGKDAYYATGRDVVSLELAEKIPLLAKVNKMFKDQYGIDIIAETFPFTAMMVLAEAINRAGSTDKEAIRKALAETDIPADQLIVSWKGIKFDAKGQNIYGQWLFHQIIDGKWRIVWPSDIASAELVFPMPKWNER